MTTLEDLLDSPLSEGQPIRLSVFGAISSANVAEATDKLVTLYKPRPFVCLAPLACSQSCFSDFQREGED
jgi:hypothetical protein